MSDSRIANRAKASAKMTQSVNPRGKILVVDDDPGSRLLIRRILERAGWVVEDVPGPVEAMRCLRGAEPSFTLAVLDIVLAGDDSGMSLAEDLHREDPNLMFLFVSGYLDLDVSSAAIPIQATSFLGKPLSETRFLEEIAALERRARKT